MRSKEVNFWYWLVDRLPNKLVYFCYLHVLAYATTGKYSRTNPDSLTLLDALKRYSEDKGIE